MAASDILSQDEVDALLSGVADGEIETGTGRAGKEKAIGPYDFSSEDRIVRARMPALEMINERFVRRLRRSLFNLFRRAIDINTAGMQVIKFSEYIHTLFVPTNLNMVQMPPLQGTSLLVFDPKLVFMMVDNYFGGSGRAYANQSYGRIEGREFTPTEVRVIQLVLEKVFADLEQAWEPVLSVRFEYLQAEPNPQFATIVSPSEVVVVSTFHVEFDGGGGEFHVTLPYAMLEPIRELLEAERQNNSSQVDQCWEQTLQEQILDAEVELSCTLAETQLSLREILALEPGDILPIELSSILTAVADGVPVFRARYGVHNDNYALKLVEPLPQRGLFVEKSILSHKVTYDRSS